MGYFADRLRGLLDWLSTDPLRRAVAITVTLALLVWGAWFGFVPLLGLSAGISEGRYGDPFGILYTLFTGLTLATVVITLFQLRREARRAERARLDSAEDLARLFFDPEMKTIRDAVFATRVGWLKEEFDRAAFARFWIDTEHLPPEEAETSEGTSSPKLPDPGPTSRLIDYYAALYHRLRWLPDDQESQKLKRKLIQRYLWPYWRGYLLQLGHTIRSECEKWTADNPQMAGQYPLAPWIADLYALNTMSGLPEYEQNAHPYDRQHMPGA